MPSSVRLESEQQRMERVLFTPAALNSKGKKKLSKQTQEVSQELMRNPTTYVKNVEYKVSGTSNTLYVNTG